MPSNNVVLYGLLGIQKASGYEKPRPKAQWLDQKAQWLDQKASGLKWVQILTKSIAPKEFSTRALTSLGSIEGRTHPPFSRTNHDL